MADHLASLREVNFTWQTTGLQACREVSLKLRAGSIHALVGENGAGKTTLGHILSGVRRPDSGILEFGDRIINLKEKPGGIIPGIGLIRQRSIWPPVLSVRESAVLGRKDTPKRIRDQINAFRTTAAEWGLGDIDPRQSVSRMDAAALQRAELIASLMFNPRILVLDEPSSAWEEGRGDEFFRLLNQLRDSGRTVLLITHRLNDVFSTADMVTVMRHGTVTGTWETDQTDYSTLTRNMFGDAAEKMDEDLPAVGSPPPVETSPVLQAENIGVSVSGRRELQDVSFQLRSGEILGITGLREEGLSFLEDVISGNRKPGTGVLKIDSRTVPGAAAGMRKAGLHYVPSDKTGRGASLGSTMAENMMILESRRLARRGWLHPKRIQRWTEGRKREGEINGDPDQKLDEFSGGNIQKVILQREITRNTRLLVVADPTWGLDELSRRKIHLKLRQIRDHGAAILLLASDLDEALELSDRMGVIYAGRLSTVRPSGDWNRNDAARQLAGIAE